jgi:hypothetical protein
MPEHGVIIKECRSGPLENCCSIQDLRNGIMEDSDASDSESSVRQYLKPACVELRQAKAKLFTQRALAMCLEEEIKNLERRCQSLRRSYSCTPFSLPKAQMPEDLKLVKLPPPPIFLFRTRFNRSSCNPSSRSMNLTTASSHMKRPAALHAQSLSPSFVQTTNSIPQSPRSTPSATSSMVALRYPRRPSLPSTWPSLAQHVALLLHQVVGRA